MKEKLKSKKGITLISLVITITVLIILASIATYSGINVIKQSKLNKFTAEMKIMQTEVNNLYDRYSSGETSVLGAGKELDSEANNVFTTNASGIADSSGYRYYDRETIESLGIEEVEEEFYVNVEKRSVISRLGIEYEGEKYYTLEQLPNGLYNVEYDNKNSNGPEFSVVIEQEDNGEIKIEVTDITYDRGYINKWEVKYKLEGEEAWRTSEDFEFNVKDFGKYKVKVVNGEIESEEKEVEIKAVAQIGNKKYVTLEKAVKAVGYEETEILMIDNTEESVTFPDGKKIILNLSDKTITGNHINYGTLTIKGNGKIQGGIQDIVETDDYEVLANYNVLNIEGGTIESNINNNIVVLNKGTTNMKGGLITSYQDWVSFKNHGTFNFDGGTIEFKEDKLMTGTALYNFEGTINMTGGTVNSNGFGVVVDAGKLNATGGSIISSNYDALFVRNNGSAECDSVEIKNDSYSAVSNSTADYGNCIIRSRASNYGITGPVIGKVIATSNTEAGQASENVTIYNTTYQYLLFPTWSEKVVGGTSQDDLIWTQSYSANGTHTITVKKSDHNNDIGTYLVDIYGANSNYEVQGNTIVRITLTF